MLLYAFEDLILWCKNGQKFLYNRANVAVNTIKKTQMKTQVLNSFKI